MPRKGREFERLVELLESFLVPEGAEVKSPDYIPDNITGDPREVDISIRMHVGSIPVLIIVECRDRAGAEDVTWIEQLKTKRDAVNAAKAVAVSASGFSRNAQKTARFYGIETRHIDEITPDDIRDWWQAGEMILFQRKSHIHRVSVDLDSDLPYDEIQIDEDTAHRLSRCSVDDDLFICKKDGKECNLKTIWGWIPKDKEDDIYRGVPQNGSKIRYTLVMNFPVVRERYQFPTKSGPVDISLITLLVDLWIEPSRVPIKNIHSYMSPETLLVQTVEYEMDIQGRRNIISIHRVSESGQISIGGRVTKSEDTNGA